MSLIPNDWKHLLKAETSQKSLLKIFCYNNKVTRNSPKYNKPFKFISRPNFLEGQTIIMGTSFQFHHGVQLNILPILSSEILLLNWA